MNLTTLSGNLTRKPDLKYTPAGKAVASATLAVDHGHGDTARTTFHDLQLWEERAELAARLWTKGLRLVVWGALDQDTWEDKETQKPRRRDFVKVSGWEFGERKREEGGEGDRDRGQD